MSDSFKAEVSSIGEIAGVMSFIEELAERHALPETAVFHLQLACDELLTNAISYGFPDGGSPKIYISIALKGDTIETEIVDNGIAFNPLAQPEPDINLPLEERKIGGLGVLIIRTVMNRLDYHRSDGHNHLKMVLQLPANSANKGDKSWPIPS